MIWIDSYKIPDAIGYAHEVAHDYCWNLNYSSFDFNIEDHTRFIYSMKFTEALMEILSDYDTSSSDTRAWDIKELEKHLNDYGFRVEKERVRRLTILTVMIGDVQAVFEDDKKSKSMILCHEEYAMERWDPGIINLLTTIKEELAPSELYRRTQDCIHRHNICKIQQDVMTTTALSIVHDRFRDTDYTIHRGFVIGDIFVGCIESEGGKINIECKICDLSDRLDSILQQKQDFDVLTSGLLEENY